MAVTTVEGKIARAVGLRVGTLDLGLPIAWQNIDFDPAKDVPQTGPPAGKWLRVQHVPNTVQRIPTYGRKTVHRFLGLLQVSVHWPKGRGEIEPREVAGQIVAHFPRDLVLTEDDVVVKITKRPEARGMMPDEDVGVQIPVMINYEMLLFEAPEQET